jgi:site-specific DNA recombinase
MTKTSGIIYARVSTNEQAKNMTIRAQLPVCRELARRHGIDVVQVVQDDGVTGTRLQGRKLASVLDQIESGALSIDYIVVQNFDRICRVADGQMQSEIDGVRIKCVLQDAGVKVLDATGTKDPGDIFAYGISRLVASDERERIIRRTRDGRAERIQRGNYVWTTPPYGYKRVPDDPERHGRGWHLEPHPVNADRMRQIVDWVIRHGYAGAAERCIDEGWETPSERGKWRASTLNVIFSKIQRYATGEFEYLYRGRRGVVQVPPLITPETLHALEDAVQMRKRPDATRLVHLTTSTTQCASCGHGLNTSTTRGGKYSYTFCRGCREAMRTELLEQYLWEAVRMRTVWVLEHVSAVSALDELQDALALAKQKVVTTNAALDQLLDLYLAGGISKDRYLPRHDTHQRDLLRAKTEVRSLQKRLKDAAKEESRADVYRREMPKLLALSDPSLLEKRQHLAMLAPSKVRIGWDETTITFTFLEAGGIPETAYRCDRKAPGQIDQV